MEDRGSSLGADGLAEKACARQNVGGGFLLIAKSDFERATACGALPLQDRGLILKRFSQFVALFVRLGNVHPGIAVRCLLPEINVQDWDGHRLSIPEI